MSQRVLRDKAEREERWRRAMALWENIPKEASPDEAGALIEDLLRGVPIHPDSCRAAAVPISSPVPGELTLGCNDINLPHRDI